MTVRSEDAVEIVRASLALAFPGASVDALARAAEHLLRWGAEGAAEHITPELSERMLEDLMFLSDFQPGEYRPAEPERRRPQAAPYRTWSRPDQAEDEYPFRRRPPDPDDGTTRRRDPGGPQPSAG
ncbi:hypothetical protein [Streptomyces diastatochromogenes]|uniref:Uncharacterized protein n=1 Tax=Streptomyces diastatochromogenes TaxID=42236 RepID=A0A233S3S6_STRDA|nr:hypothetical protein [Streptomyces diastatochromogenes]MCZ0985837.1 hypothetical protein [Streptomyces diastatochromogenes]OXY90194.1 hypothetical protein BEK98_34820 [Streptomyces diastatochromogenes]